MLTTNLSNLPYLARKFIQFTCHGSLGSQYCGTDWALSPLPATDGWECSANNGHFSMVFFWLGLKLPTCVRPLPVFSFRAQALFAVINATDPQGHSADLVLAQFSRAPLIHFILISTLVGTDLILCEYLPRLDAVLPQLRAV